MREMEECDSVRFVIGCWALWEGRNNNLFGGKEFRLDRVVKRVYEIIGEMREVLEGSGKRSMEGVVSDRWLRPQSGWLKINVDASVREGIGVGVGAVCINEEGRVMWGVTEQMSEMMEPSKAEAFAILVELKEAARYGVQQVIIESDCSMVIDALKLKRSGRSAIYFLFDEIHKISSVFRSCIWSCVRRGCNKVAHELARASP
ncbi:uncharacterized protein LOC141595084 [Silene latifolia]|uniref:uncharacterized protein LOC141595084 n=1 Tax=Silene latifolia TaxID=37657 RepID=UPI003D77E68B